jgi:hypothetical protein
MEDHAESARMPRSQCLSGRHSACMLKRDRRWARTWGDVLKGDNITAVSPV